MYEEYISYLLNIIVIRISYAVKGIGHLQIYIQSYHILYIYVGVSVWSVRFSRSTYYDSYVFKQWNTLADLPNTEKGKQCMLNTVNIVYIEPAIMHVNIKKTYSWHILYIIQRYFSSTMHCKTIADSLSI